MHLSIVGVHRKNYREKGIDGFDPVKAAAKKKTSVDKKRWTVIFGVSIA